MNNWVIEKKLKSLAASTAIGFIVVAIITGFQLNTLSNEYKKSQYINKQVSNHKSMINGGLLVNSATNVYIMDATNNKPINTIKKGIESLEKNIKSTKQFDKEDYRSHADDINNFLVVATKIYNKAITGEDVIMEDSILLLKKWRPLKYKIQDHLKILQEKNEILAEEFASTISNTIMILAVTIIIMLIASTTLSSLIGRNITNGIKTLHSGVLKLKDSKNSTSKIKLDTNDELGSIAKDFNKYIQSIENKLEEDKTIINEAKSVINNVKQGCYSQYIEKSTSNELLNEFKDSVNDMIKSTQKHITITNKALDKYTNLNYKDKLVIENIIKDGAFDKMGNNINKLRESIVSMLNENRSNGLMLQNDSSKLLSNVDAIDLASSSAASSLEKTTIELKDIAINITNTKNNTVKMSEYASGLNESVSIGESLTTQTTIAMNDIGTEVEAIQEAIAVIDQIAFQTNILSLNAAVEAATAGEVGKGFAVVASEVRNLASKSASAASSIKELVESAKQKTDQGKTIAQQMSHGYKSLNENISKTVDIINSVENASKEQEISITKINDAITTLDKQTQQNASVANETKHIATKTKNLADTIVEDVQRKEFA